MKMAKTYDVEEYQLGKIAENKILFKTIEDMEQAYKDIDNGNDICIAKDGVVVKLLHKIINTKVYDGTLVLCAKGEVNK
jgi:hypothetical protein